MNKRPPIWLLPNLLSLDAPLVAVVWMWMIARSMSVQYVESSSYLVLAVAVWCVYVLDRIHDVKKGIHPIKDEMPWRHEFHWKYRKILLPVVVCLVLYCGYASLFILSREMLSIGVVGVVLTLIYYVISKFERSEVSYFKNFVAGMTFAFGVAAPAVVYSQQMPMVVSDALEPFLRGLEAASASAVVNGFFTMLLKLGLMVVTTFFTVMMSSHVSLFGLLCVMNITAIDLWERSRRSDDIEVKQNSEFSLSAGLVALVAGAVLSLSFGKDDYAAALCYAVLVSAGLLQMINRRRSRFSVDAQRVLADLALIIPAPLALLMS